MTSYNFSIKMYIDTMYCDTFVISIYNIYILILLIRSVKIDNYHASFALINYYYFDFI